MNLKLGARFKDYWTSAYKHITIIPSLSFVIDRQEEYTLTFCGETHEGVIEYSLYFNWITFTANITLEIKSGK